jgi:small basic protein
MTIELTVPRLVLLLQVAGFLIASVVLGFIYHKVGLGLSLGFMIGFGVHLFGDLWKIRREGL